jgi:type I site-specific restriction endonuclease
MAKIEDLIRQISVDRRDRLTRKVRWEQLDEDLAYVPNEFDHAVVAPDQIRTLISTFRDRIFSEISAGRTTVPKTLIFERMTRGTQTDGEAYLVTGNPKALGMNFSNR